MNNVFLNTGAVLKKILKQCFEFVEDDEAQCTNIPLQ